MPRLWLQTNSLRCDLQEDDAGSADRRAVQEVARPIQNARGEAVPVSSDLGHHRRLESAAERDSVAKLPKCRGINFPEIDQTSRNHRTM